MAITDRQCNITYTVCSSDKQWLSGGSCDRINQRLHANTDQLRTFQHTLLIITYIQSHLIQSDTL